MLYSLEQVLAGRKPPITIQHDALVIDALHIMMEYRLGQLPVVDHEGMLKGIVSQQTLLGDYFITGGRVSLLNLAVHDCMEQAQTLSINDDLLRAVDQLRQLETYAIVVTREQKPVGILTGKDMSVFFRSVFEGMLLVERIEKYLRAAITDILPDEVSLNKALVATFGPAKGHPDKPARGENYLSFGDMIFLIQDNDNWPLFQPIFEPRPFFEALMDRARLVRNELAHFQGHPDVIDIDTLRRAVYWLSNRPPLPAPAGVKATATAPADDTQTGLQTLERVLEGRRPPVCTGPKTPLRESMRMMVENRYGQLPVIDDNGHLLGIVSQQSILRVYYHTEGAVAILDLPTDHFIDIMPVLHPDDDLFAAVEVLAEPGIYAAVVIDGNKPVGLLTGKDMTQFFRTLFEGIILVERIETKLREYVAQAYPDAASLNVAARAAFGPDRKNPALAVRNPNRMTFGDRLIFMCDDDVWPAFDKVLGPRDLFMHLVERVRRVRNSLLHFNGRLTYPEYDSLLLTQAWLARRRPLDGPAPTLSAEQGVQVGGGSNPYLQFAQRQLRTSVPQAVGAKAGLPSVE